jgi:hypothetical protein
MGQIASLRTGSDRLESTIDGARAPPSVKEIATAFWCERIPRACDIVSWQSRPTPGIE